MIDNLSHSGQVTAFELVGVVLVVLPVGLATIAGQPRSSTATYTVGTSSVPPTVTTSPTPVGEPGFGVITWSVGVLVVACLFVARRRPAIGGVWDRD